MLDFYRFKDFEKYPSLFHAVTTKSDSLPHHFSLALHTGEDKQGIIHNRQTLAKQLHLKTKTHFIVANQTHSANITVIDKKSTKGWESLETAIEDSDALITNLPNTILTILTADCVPVLLYDPEQKVVAAIHAGWKGTEAQIVTKTVQKMQDIFGSNPSNIIAGIAPSIGRCCYEVGEDVAKHFFDIPKAYTPLHEKYMLDLPYINKEQLLKSGIKEAHICMSNICTACDYKHFFSYRKEAGCSGRFMSMIGLEG